MITDKTGRTGDKNFSDTVARFSGFSRLSGLSGLSGFELKAYQDIRVSGYQRTTWYSGILNILPTGTLIILERWARL